MNPTRELLTRKIAEKNARVGVIGLGYVGLPLLHAFIKAGFGIIGYDGDQAKVIRLLATEMRNTASESLTKCLIRA